MTDPEYDPEKLFEAFQRIVHDPDITREELEDLHRAVKELKAEVQKQMDAAIQRAWDRS